MSFALTTRQFLLGEKDVTRRDGWEDLKPGEHFMACVKAMGLKKGEKIERLGECVCISNTREPLTAITFADCCREGFPELAPAQFCAMYVKHNGGQISGRMVSRIVFDRIPDTKLERAVRACKLALPEILIARHCRKIPQLEELHPGSSVAMALAALNDVLKENGGGQ